MTTQTQDQAMAELDAVAALAGKSGADAIRWIQSELQRVTEWLDETEKERKRLQLKLADIDRQEPVAWLVTKPVDVDVGITQETDLEWECWPEEDGYKNDPLYLAPPAPAVPDGWKLVPIEATDEMCAIMTESEGDTITNGPGFAQIVYQEMLAAAPTPPASDDKRVHCGYCDGSGTVETPGPCFAPCPVCSKEADDSSDDRRDAERWRYLRENISPIAFASIIGISLPNYTDEQFEKIGLWTGWMDSEIDSAIDAMREGGSE